jgi:hypothetical protein
MHKRTHDTTNGNRQPFAFDLKILNAGGRMPGVPDVGAFLRGADKYRITASKRHVCCAVLGQYAGSLEHLDLLCASYDLTD